MNYFVSWAAAELPEAAASKHYTEKLVLLPAHTMHQYYEHRYWIEQITLSHRYSRNERMCACACACLHVCIFV